MCGGEERKERYNMDKVESFGEFSIRRNDVSTIKDAVALSRGLYDESRESFGFDSFLIRGFIAGVIQSGGLLLVAYSGETAVGFILAARGFNPILGRVAADEIAIFTKKEVRGGQLGNKLVDMFEEWGTSSGATRLSATVQDSINHDSTVRFFSRRGYRRQETKLIKEV